MQTQFWLFLAISDSNLAARRRRSPCRCLFWVAQGWKEPRSMVIFSSSLPSSPFSSSFGLTGFCCCLPINVKISKKKGYPLLILLLDLSACFRCNPTVCIQARNRRQWWGFPFCWYSKNESMGTKFVAYWPHTACVCVGSSDRNWILNWF